jgi:hypothetical protein
MSSANPTSAQATMSAGVSASPNANGSTGTAAPVAKKAKLDRPADVADPTASRASVGDAS